MLGKLIVALLNRVPIQHLDRIAVLLHKVATSIGVDGFACQVDLVRLEWRRRFEKAIQELGVSRARGYVDTFVDFYRDSGHAISPNAAKVVFGRLVHALAADASFVETMAELQRLPIGPRSSYSRIAALDEAVERYLPDIAQDELASEIDLAAGFGGEEN